MPGRLSKPHCGPNLGEATLWAAARACIGRHLQHGEEVKTMAIGPDAKAGFLALNRFAFGARGGAYAGDLARAASDPRGLLKAELMQPGIAHLSAPTLPTTKAALQAAFAEQERIRIARQNGAAQSPSPQMAAPANAEPPAARDGMGTPSTPAPSDAAAAPGGPGGAVL